MKHWQNETVCNIDRVIWMGMPYLHIYTEETGDIPFLEGSWFSIFMFDAIVSVFPETFNGAWYRYEGSYWPALWRWLVGDWMKAEPE